MSYELFINDEIHRAVHDIALTVKEQTELDELVIWISDAYKNHQLGQMLHESNSFELGAYLKEAFIREKYDLVVEAFAHLGTYEAYILLLKATFGEDITIVFTNPSAGVLNVTVDNYGVDGDNLTTQVPDNLTTQVPENLVTRKIDSLLSPKEMELLLQQMVPEGIFATFTFL